MAMTESQKKELFFRVVEEKMQEFDGKEIFYQAFGTFCHREAQTAKRWVRTGKFPRAREEIKSMWEFLGMELLDNGDIVKRMGQKAARPALLPLMDMRDFRQRLVDCMRQFDRLLEDYSIELEEGQERKRKAG